MARNNYRGGSSRRAPKDLGRRVKKKPCVMCRDGVEWVDYKDVPVLRKYMSDRGKIRSRRVTGNCAQHQRDIARAIKVARELVLLPYTQRTVTEKPGGRGGRGERGERGERDRGGFRGDRGDRGDRGQGDRQGPPRAAEADGTGEASEAASAASGAAGDEVVAEPAVTEPAGAIAEPAGEPGGNGAVASAGDAAGEGEAP